MQPVVVKFDACHITLMLSYVNSHKAVRGLSEGCQRVVRGLSEGCQRVVRGLVVRGLVVRGLVVRGLVVRGLVVRGLSIKLKQPCDYPKFVISVGSDKL